jgi:dynein heavy chain
LKEAQEKTDKLLQNLEKESKKANQKKDEVEATTKACKQQKEMIDAEKQAAEKDLEAAMPALVRAQEAVEGIEAKDIVEMKANKAPLDIIKYIMDSVCVFF